MLGVNRKNVLFVTQNEKSVLSSVPIKDIYDIIEQGTSQISIAVKSDKKGKYQAISIKGPQVKHFERLVQEYAPKLTAN